MISHSLFLFASTLDRSDRVSREIGIAVFGLGFLLPLLGGGNVLFTFEPTEALPFWLVAVFGTAVLLRRNPTRPPIEGADWTTAMLLVFLVWWTVASLLRHSGPRVPMETQALLSGVLLYVGLSTCSIPAAAVEKLVVGLLLGTIGTALTFLHVDAFWEKAIQGGIILAAVVSAAARLPARRAHAAG